MAVLSKIRKLPPIILIIVIGVALLTFIVSPSALKNFFNADKFSSVAEVSGEKISRNEFVTALDNYKKQTGGRVSDIQASKIVFNNLMRNKVYDNQLEQAGITIGEADILNQIYDTEFVKKDPRFQTAGVFDKNKLKQYLADVKQNKPQEWAGWQNYMANVKNGLQKSTYNNLVSVGLNASLKEGEMKYVTENTKINSNFVFVPFSSVKDDEVTIKTSEVKDYIESHKSEFQVDASRDIKYVRFDVKPTQKDEQNLKVKMLTLLNDREEYSNTAKTNVTVKGLKSTNDYNAFFIDNKSDLPYDAGYQFKSSISAKEAGAKLFAGAKGDVFGPYKDKGYLKLSKIVDVATMPDSVKARHILIPFVGSRASNKDTKKTEEQAKKEADSLLAVVEKSPKDFEKLAKDFSKGPSASKGGDLGWFTYNTMVPEFRDYCFSNKKGDIGVVKTIFGFHIVKIDDQKNQQKVLKLATFGRKIEASEETENNVFENASVFEQELSSGKTFDEVAKEKGLKVMSSVGLKPLSESVSGLGNQRSIISWSFGKDTKVGDYKRFDIEKGYVIATVIDETHKGLMPVKKAVAKVRPILVNQKKVKLIEDKMKGATLEEMANATKTTVRKVSGVTLKTPTISGVGYEPNIVGAMLYAKGDKVYKNIVGDRGVFAIKVINREAPIKLPNYNAERNRIVNQRKNSSYKVYEAIKKASDVKDNLNYFYGIQE